MARGGVQVTPRDRLMLAWIGRHGIVTPDQVARRYFLGSDGVVGKRAACRRLLKLEICGLVQRDATSLYRSPQVIRITRAGARARLPRSHGARDPDGSLPRAVVRLASTGTWTYARR